jgi:hypothetical protein
VVLHPFAECTTSAKFSRSIQSQMLIEKKSFTEGKLQVEEMYNGSMSSYMCERILCLPVDSNQIIL